MPPASCDAETTKESIKSTNLEYRARERQTKRESGRQASEAQRDKGRERSRARDKKERRHFFVGRTT